jgi:hypothetical protein
METEVRGDGESRRAEGKKEIGFSGGRYWSRFGQGFSAVPQEKKPLEGEASSENGGRAETETGWESEEKTKPLAGTPRAARGGYESPMGREKSRDGGESAVVVARSPSICRQTRLSG